MSWTGTRPPKRIVVKTTYEDGRFVRQQTETHSYGGGMNVTEIRCTCQWPEVGCSLHGKSPEPPA